MVVMFDLDGVLVNFLGGYRRLQEQMGKPVTMSATWDDYLDKDVWREIKASPVFWSALGPLITEVDLVRIDRLQASRAVYFSSSRAGLNVANQTKSWLMAQGISRPTVIISRNKGEVAKAINADFSIEDKAGNAVYIAYHAPRCRSFLLDGDGISTDRCYNRFDSTVMGRRVERITSVTEYLEEIENAN